LSLIFSHSPKRPRQPDVGLPEHWTQRLTAFWSSHDGRALRNPWGVFIDGSKDIEFENASLLGNLLASTNIECSESALFIDRAARVADQG
jgi:hypothetical protein